VTLADTTVASDITAGSDGSWSASFVVPALPSGAYPVLASGLLPSWSVLERPGVRVRL
jgi:hypothetical protein